MKIMELHYNPNAEGGEEYTIITEKGISRVTAVAHMMRAVAEGLIELQTALEPLLNLIMQLDQGALNAYKELVPEKKALDAYLDKIRNEEKGPDAFKKNILSDWGE